jgi:hypothetical protein
MALASVPLPSANNAHVLFLAFENDKHTVKIAQHTKRHGLKSMQVNIHLHGVVTGPHMHMGGHLLSNEKERAHLNCGGSGYLEFYLAIRAHCVVIWRSGANHWCTN